MTGPRSKIPGMAPHASRDMSTPPPSRPTGQESGEHPSEIADVLAYVLGEQDVAERAAFERRLATDAGLSELVKFARESVEYRRDERELGVSAAAIANAKRVFRVQRAGLLTRLRDGGARVIAALDFDTRLAPGALGVRGGGGAQLAFSAAQAEADFELVPSSEPDHWTLRGQIDSDTNTPWTLEVRGDDPGHATRSLQTSSSGSFTMDLPQGVYTVLASHDSIEDGVTIEFGPIQVP